MKGQTLAETIVDIVIGLKSLDVLVPQGNMLKIGFGQVFPVAWSCLVANPGCMTVLLLKKILVFANTG